MTNPVEDAILVNVNKAAEMMGVSKEMLYAEIRKNRLPVIRRGKRLTLVKVEDLYKWADAQEAFYSNIK